MTDSQSPEKTFTLTEDATGKSVKLPILSGTLGPDVIDVRKLYAQTGNFTFDPSYTSTASCKGWRYLRCHKPSGLPSQYSMPWNSARPRRRGVRR